MTDGTLLKGSNSFAARMEESGFIEPLTDTDEELPDLGEEITSDYEPSEDGTTFGSLTSSVTGHVWEYGRCVPLVTVPMLSTTC